MPQLPQINDVIDGLTNDMLPVLSYASAGVQKAARSANSRLSDAAQDYIAALEWDRKRDDGTLPVKTIASANSMLSAHCTRGLAQEYGARTSMQEAIDGLLDAVSTESRLRWNEVVRIQKELADQLTALGFPGGVAERISFKEENSRRDAARYRHSELNADQHQIMAAASRNRKRLAVLEQQRAGTYGQEAPKADARFIVPPGPDAGA